MSCGGGRAAAVMVAREAPIGVHVRIGGEGLRGVEASHTHKCCFAWTLQKEYARRRRRERF